MALIRKFMEVHKEANHVHDTVECGWTMFESDGVTYVQFDTYGSGERQIPRSTAEVSIRAMNRARPLRYKGEVSARSARASGAAAGPQDLLRRARGCGDAPLEDVLDAAAATWSAQRIALDEAQPAS